MTDQRIDAVARLRESITNAVAESLCDCEPRGEAPCMSHHFEAEDMVEQLVGGLTLAEGREEAPRFVCCEPCHAVREAAERFAYHSNADMERAARARLMEVLAIPCAAPLPTPAPRLPSEAAIAEFMRAYFPPATLEAAKADIIETDPCITRHDAIRACVSIGLSAAYVVDGLPTPAGSEENERND